MEQGQVGQPPRDRAEERTAGPQGFWVWALSLGHYAFMQTPTQTFCYWFDRGRWHTSMSRPPAQPDSANGAPVKPAWRGLILQSWTGKGSSCSPELTEQWQNPSALWNSLLGRSGIPLEIQPQWKWNIREWRAEPGLSPVGENACLACTRPGG